MSDTIYALATTPGRAAVAIIRVSGLRAGEVLESLAGPKPPPRLAALRALRDPGTGELIDRGLVLWFPGPGSFSGEDVVEFQVHGGLAVVDALSVSLSRLLVRPAAPGEFTRRAFEHGRLELSQAEAVADLVDAETAEQRRQALKQLGGALAGRHNHWRTLLLEAAAALEASIDFPEEGLSPHDQVVELLRKLRTELAGALADRRGEQVRAGLKIAIFGPPNSGKSSLLNRLLGEEAAIVSPHAGTTRDVVTRTYEAGPFRVSLADTAGIHAAAEDVEAEGVRRAAEQCREADLRILVVDGSRCDALWAPLVRWLRKGDLMVINKADLAPGLDPGPTETVPGVTRLRASALLGTGIEAVRIALEQRISASMVGSDFPATTRERHRALLEQAFAAVGRAIDARKPEPELLAEDLRAATHALSRVTGRIGNEDVLEALFSSFCIGK